MRRLLCLIPILMLLVSCQTPMPPYAHVDSDETNRAAGAYAFNQEHNGLPQFSHKIGPGPEFRH
jgi:hypothetical protein